MKKLKIVKILGDRKFGVFWKTNFYVWGVQIGRWQIGWLNNEGVKVVK